MAINLLKAFAPDSNLFICQGKARQLVSEGKAAFAYQQHLDDEISTVFFLCFRHFFFSFLVICREEFLIKCRGSFMRNSGGDAICCWRKWIMKDLGVLYFVSFREGAFD